MTESTTEKFKLMNLKDKVEDLSTKFNIYKESYKGLKVTDTCEQGQEPNNSRGKVPFFVDKNKFAPLIKEYDELINNLKTGKSEYEEEIDKIAGLTNKLKQRPSSTDSPQSCDEYSHNGDEEDLSVHQDDNDTIEASSEFNPQKQGSSEWVMKEFMSLKELESIIVKSLDDMMDGRGIDENTKPSLSSISIPSRPAASLFSVFSQYQTTMESKIKDLNRESDELRKRLQEVQQNVLEGSLDITGGLKEVANNNLQLTEQALKQRDASLWKEQQAQKEIMRLTEVIDELMNGAKVAMSKQFTKLKIENNEKMNNIESKLSSYEKNKKRLENELMEGLEENRKKGSDLASVVQVSESTMSILSNKFSMVTQEREHLAGKVISLQEQLRIVEKRFSKEKECLVEEKERMKNKLSEMNKEHGWMEEERKRLMKELQDLKGDFLNEKRAKENSTRILSKQVLVLQQLVKTKEIEFNTKVDCLIREHHKELLIMNNNINNKKKSAFITKEKTEEMIKRMDNKVMELKKELEEEKAKKIEALILLQHHQLRTRQAELKLQKHSRDIGELEMKLIETHHKSSVVNSQTNKTQWKDSTYEDPFQELKRLLNLGSSTC